MRSVCLTAVAAFSIFASAGLAQAQSLSVTNYQLVDQQNISPTKANMTYKADLVNQGSALSAVVATVTGLDPFSVRVVQGLDTLKFLAIPANGKVTSTNTFTIQIDPTVPFDFNSKLQWTFDAIAGGPVANAGLSQTASVGSMVTLNGSGSTSPSGAPLTYNWTFAAIPQGSATFLSHSNSVMPTFFVDVPGVYVITLTVSDGTSSSSANVIVSTLSAPPPTAKAGPDQTVTLGSTVSLNGGQSTSGSGNPLTYSWMFTAVPAGSQAVLSSVTTVSPTFVADKTGTYIVQLIVNDGVASSVPSTVKITTQAVKPVANAGSSQSVHVNDVVKLNGAGSTDANGLPLTYQWNLISVPQGSNAALTNSASVNPTFTADLQGIYVAQLIVNNGVLSSDPSTVTINVTTLVQPPAASAGPNQTVTIGSVVTLSGSGTDPQNLPLTYQWTLITKPAGSAAVLSNTLIPNPTFIADVTGTYIAQLIVNNGTLSSQPSTVTISTSCSQPTANAGLAQSVNSGTTVTLNGSGSGDACNDPLTYSWSFTTRPAGSAATLSGATSVSPSFVADVAGTYVVQLIVNNGLTNSNPATVTITATFVPPVDITLPANLTIQPDQQVDFTVTLAKPAGPGGVFISLSSSDSSIVSLRASNIIIREGDTTSSQPKVTGGNVGSATITATASGLNPATQTVQVTNSLTLSFQPPSLTFTSGAVQNLVLTSSTPPPAPLVINLSSSNPNAATVPSTVTFPAGTLTVNVPVIPVGAGITTIHASALPNIADTTATVTVQGLASISLPANTSVSLGQTAPFAVSISPAAPAGGLTINLTSSDPTKVTAPSSVLIAAGATTPATQPQITGAGIGSATITATAASYGTASGAVNVTGTISFSPSSATIGIGSQNLTLNLSAPTSSPLTVNLASGDTSKVTVPTTVTIAAGASSVQVPVTGVAAGGPVTIAASAAGVNNTTASVTVVPGSPIGVPATTSIGLGQSATFAVTLPSAAPAGGLTVNLTSSDTSKVTIPASVFIAAGSTTPATQPQVTGVGVGSATITASASGLSSGTGTVTVPAPTISFSGSPLSVTIGTTGTLTLNLSGGVAPTGGLTVNLTSSDTSKATVPATVSITAGASSVPVTVTGVAQGAATITASATGLASTTASVNVTNLPAISVTSLSVGLGQSDTLQVSLPAPAASNVTVTLVSSDTGKVTVSPSSVTILTGATSPTTQPQVVGAGIGSASITASATGYSNGTGTVTVPAPTMAFSGSPLSVLIGTTGTLTLNLSGGQAPAGGLIVNLTSSDTSKATVPATVNFAGGSASATVTVSGLAQGSATITASTAGIASAAATVNVSPLPAIVVSSATVNLGQTATLQVSLPAPAASTVTVQLTSGDNSKVTVSPSSVVILTGSTTPSTNPQVSAVGIGPVNITASAPGYSNGTGTVTVPAPVLSFSGSPLSVTTGTTGTLTLNLTGGQAPSGGLTVNLSSSDSSKASVPPTVTLGAGTTSAIVTVNGVAQGSATITASASGIASATASVTVVPQPTISIAPVTVGLGQTANLQVTLSAAPATNLTVNLASSDGTKVALSSSTVTVFAGTTTAQAQVTGLAAGSPAATINATASGYASGSGVVNVTATISFAGGLTLNPGATGNLTINLTGGVAPSSGLTVNLSSSNTGVATLPSSVSFSPGAVSASVTVTAVGGGTSTITASATNIAAATTTVTVPIQITVSPVSVGLGLSTNLQITLAKAAPAGGVTLSLASSDTTKVTVPATVVIAAGTTTPSVPPQVTGAGIGQATITASASGFLSGNSTVTVTAPTLSFTGSPLSVSLPTPGTGTLTLNLSGGKAPAGGLTVNLASSDTSKATVPQTVNFAAGSTSASVTVTGVAAGSATITASAANISPTTASVTVAVFIAINVPSSLSLTTGQSTALTVTLAQAAPAGGATVNLSTSDSSKVTVSPASVSIAAGAVSPATQPQITAVAAGSATITASGTNLISASTVVTVTPPVLSLSFAGDVTVNAGLNTKVTLNLKGGVAPAGGLTVNIITNPPSIAMVSGGSATFAAGSTSTQVTVTGVAQGTALMTANAPGIPATTANITVLTPISPLLQPIVVPSISVGQNLQAQITLALLTMTSCAVGDKLPQGEICSAVGPSGALVIASSTTGTPILFPVQAPSAVTMTVTSSDPSKLLVGLRGVCPGVAIPAQTTVCGAQQVVAAIPASLSTTSVYLQGLASSGTAIVTATAPGYPSNQATITLTPSGFVLTGPNATTSVSTFVGASPTQMTVSSVRLDSSLRVAEAQQLRTGYKDPINGPFDDAQGTITCNQVFTAPADIQSCISSAKYAYNNLSGIYSTSVAISSSSPTVGGVSTAVTYTGGDTSDTGFFVPSSGGNTTLTAVPPPSFSTPATGASVAVNVGLPQTNCSPITVGKNLAAIASCSLQGGTPSAGLPVTITSNDPSRLLLAVTSAQGTTCTAAGSQTITTNTVNAAQGGLNIVIPGFCAYALANTGSVTYSVTIQGYAMTTGTVNLAQSGFVIAGSAGIGSAFDVFGTNATVTVYPALLDASLNYVAQQQLAGGQSVTVNLNSSNPSVGTVSPTSLTFGPGVASNTTTFTKGAGGSLFCPGELAPIVPCTVLTAVAPAGFSTSTQASVNARVAVQNLSLSCGDSATPITLGQNLQTSCTVSVPATNPAPSGGILVTLTSPTTAKLLLSNSASALGLGTISVTIPGGGTTSSVFYIQALDSTGTPTYTASASGYPNRTAKITLAPAGIVIAGPNGLGATFFTTSSPATISVYTAALNTDPNGCPSQSAPCLLAVQPLRGGIPNLQISLNSSATSHGTIASPVTITSGGSGTVDTTFTPGTSGQTDITVVPPQGYTASTNDYKVTVTIP